MTFVDRATGEPVDLRTDILPSAARDAGWEVVGKIEMHFAWTALLAMEIEQREFERRGFSSPLPVFRQLMYWNDEIYVLELHSKLTPPGEFMLGPIT